MNKQDTPSTPSIYDPDFISHPTPGSQSEESAGTNLIINVRSVDTDQGTDPHEATANIDHTDQTYESDQPEQAAEERRKMVAYNEHGNSPEREAEATSTDQPGELQREEGGADLGHADASQNKEEMASSDYARALEERQRIKDFMAGRIKGDDTLHKLFVPIIEMDGLAQLRYKDKKAFFTSIAKELMEERNGKKPSLSNYYNTWDATVVAKSPGIQVGDAPVSVLCPLARLTPEDRQKVWEHAMAQKGKRDYPTAKQVKSSIKLMLEPDQCDEESSEPAEVDEVSVEPTDTIEVGEASDDQQESEAEPAAPIEEPPADRAHIEKLLNERQISQNDINASVAFLKLDADMRYILACMYEALTLETVTMRELKNLLKPFHLSLHKAV